MPSPFPGIDPYLESQHFWEDFHPSFLTYCRDALNEVLPGDYVAQLGERIRLVELSHDVWIAIRRGTGRTPVTIIELLSPTNKTGDGFVEYQLKRRSLIRQKIHLVELDLLLGGRRLPMSLPLPAGDYFAFVSRAQHRPDSDVYAWTIRDGLPAIPIPLLAGTADVAVDVAGVFATAYERGRYARLIDYATPPSVLRKPEDRAWAEKQRGEGAVRCLEERDDRRAGRVALAR